MIEQLKKSELVSSSTLMKILVVFCWIIACSTKTVLHVNKPTFLYVKSVTKSRHLIYYHAWIQTWSRHCISFKLTMCTKKFNVSASIFSLLCDCKQKLLSDVYAPYLVAMVSTVCALLVINLDLFNLLIVDFELGQNVNA